MEKTLELDQLREGIFLAIRGGGVRSSSAIGVLKALEEAKIPIKGISGESGSSLVAGLYAYGYDADKVKELFLKYNNTITKAAKIYGGKGSIVIQELVELETNGVTMKELPLDCWIHCAKGSLLKPELHLFSKNDSSNDTLGFACSASAGLPVFYGNTYKIIDGKKIKLFDGGMIYNPYIPEGILYPLVYSSFLNTINYQKVIPFLQKPVDAVNNKADVIINVPVGASIVTGSNSDVERLIESGYNQTQKV